MKQIFMVSLLMICSFGVAHAGEASGGVLPNSGDLNGDGVQANAPKGTEVVASIDDEENVGNRIQYFKLKAAARKITDAANNSQCASKKAEVLLRDYWVANYGEGRIGVELTTRAIYK